MTKNVPVVILCGGMGTRLAEQTDIRPKPMVEIGGKPILWHIMKEYSYYGYNEFIICAGYKQHMIKRWFADYYLHNSDITFDFTCGNKMIVHNNFSEPWLVTVVDTGLYTMTGGRIKRIQPLIANESFMMTYGDGVCDVNICKLVDFHKSHGRIATLTSVEVEQRFGILDLNEDTVRAFREKSKHDNGRINAGYMVLESKIFDYIEGDTTVFEKESLQTLAEQGELKSYFHSGFWQCMDTKNEMDRLEQMWESGNAPWKKW
jgi:glucose-1-phosphate cytidylyltransferase